MAISRATANTAAPVAPLTEQQALTAELRHVEGQLRTATAWRRAQLLDKHRELRARQRAFEMPLNADDLAGIEHWHEVRERALELAGHDEDGQCGPSVREWMRAAGDVLGLDDLQWSPDMRSALLARGCELTCRACKGDGGACGCGDPERCVCVACADCAGSGIEVQP